MNVWRVFTGGGSTSLESQSSHACWLGVTPVTSASVKDGQSRLPQEASIPSAIALLVAGSSLSQAKEGLTCRAACVLVGYLWLLEI